MVCVCCCVKTEPISLTLLCLLCFFFIVQSVYYCEVVFTVYKYRAGHFIVVPCLNNVRFCIINVFIQ